MAYGILGLLPEQFGVLTLRQFNAMVQGYGWQREMDNRSRAEALAVIINACGHMKKGTTMRADRLCPPRKNPPRNIFYRQLMGLPW